MSGYVLVGNNPTNKKQKENENKKKTDYSLFFPEWSLDEVVLPTYVKETLDDIVSYCKNKDKIVHEWDLSKFLKGNGGTVGINFYGSPGTGKSIAAEGIAKAIGMQMLRADYSEISDSLHGGTEKKLTELFRNAEANNAIIFFDEADGLLSKRTSGSSNSETNNQIKSHLLTLLDRSKAIIIFATNIFENYDKAFFRRILFHVGFEIPDRTQLIELWKFHLNERIPRDITYEELAELSNGLAGGDIKNITLKLCIRLSSGRCKSIDKDIVNIEIEKYKTSLKASERKKVIQSNVVPEIISPEIKEELNRL